MAWLDITLYYFSNKEGKQQIDRLATMLSFVRLFFFFNQSKNNAVLEASTGPFGGLVGFEAKRKDLRFEAKTNAKDLKMCP